MAQNQPKSRARSRSLALIFLALVVAIACNSVLTFWIAQEYCNYHDHNESLVEEHHWHVTSRISSNKQDQDPIRGAAFMLVGQDWATNRLNRQCYFNKSMEALQRYWYPTNPYPLYLTSERIWMNATKVEIRNNFPNLDIRFLNIANELQSPKPPAKMDDHAKPLSTIEYKRMCRYKAYGFLDVPTIQELDYVFMVDDDSCLLAPMELNVFRYMKDHSVQYAFKQLFTDVGAVIHGIESFATDYMEQNNLSYANPTLRDYLKRHPHNVNKMWAFSTNLEWIHVKEYSRSLRHFFQAIEESQYIWHRRWGDAPLRFILSFMFWNRTQVMKLCTPYHHSYSAWMTSVSQCSTPMVEDAVLRTILNCDGVPPSFCN